MFLLCKPTTAFNGLIDAGAGSDTLTGNAFDGRGDNGVLIRNAGDDSLLRGEGTDNITGSDCNDFADGGAGDDFVLGGTGADTMIGGLGSDVLDGQGGNNEFAVSDAVLIADGSEPDDVDSLNSFVSGTNQLVVFSRRNQTPFSIRMRRNEVIRLNTRGSIGAGTAASPADVIQQVAEIERV